MKSNHPKVVAVYHIKTETRGAERTSLHSAKLFLQDVPLHKSVDQIQDSLEKAGHQFEEFGRPWLNHRLAWLEDAPPEIHKDWKQKQARILSWKELQNGVLYVRTSPALANAVKRAAKSAGRPVTRWIEEVLAREVGEGE